MLLAEMRSRRDATPGIEHRASSIEHRAGGLPSILQCASGVAKRRFGTPTILRVREESMLDAQCSMPDASYEISNARVALPG
jgi:hypothetical protein